MEEVGEENIFIFGLTREDIQKLDTSGRYRPRDLYARDPRVKRVFELTGLESAFSMFETRQALVEHLATTGSQA